MALGEPQSRGLERSGSLFKDQLPAMRHCNLSCADDVWVHPQPRLFCPRVLTPCSPHREPACISFCPGSQSCLCEHHPIQRTVACCLFSITLHTDLPRSCSLTTVFLFAFFSPAAMLTRTTPVLPESSLNPTPTSLSISSPIPSTHP